MTASAPLLFLDIDGVLNTHEHDPEVLCGQIHPDKVRRLNHILRETGAMIVLSSAWRYIIHRGEANLQGMDWLLRSHGVLANRLIGITREDTMVRGVYDGEPGSWPMTDERGQQVCDWILSEGRNHPGWSGRYVVIDDMDLGISEAGHPFVLVDGMFGLSDEDAEMAVGYLVGQRVGNGSRLTPHLPDILRVARAQPLPPIKISPSLRLSLRDMRDTWNAWESDDDEQHERDERTSHTDDTGPLGPPVGSCEGSDAGTPRGGSERRHIAS
jgi:hypothetical protein